MYAIKKNYYEVMCLLIDLSRYEIDFNKKFFVIYLILTCQFTKSFLFYKLDNKSNIFNNGS